MFSKQYVDELTRLHAIDQDDAHRRLTDQERAAHNMKSDLLSEIDRLNDHHAREMAVFREDRDREIASLAGEKNRQLDELQSRVILLSDERDRARNGQTVAESKREEKAKLDELRIKELEATAHKQSLQIEKQV